MARIHRFSATEKIERRKPGRAKRDDVVLYTRIEKDLKSMLAKKAEKVGVAEAVIVRWALQEYLAEKR